MGLKDLKSTLDASILGVEGNTIANATPDANFNTLNGTSDSPFYGKDSSGDHLKDLLEDKIVRSTNTTNIYDPQQMQGLQPGPPGGDQDLDGLDGGQGYFHGVANPGKGQGKQIGGKDLHEHLLTDSYNYNHGNASENVGPSPGTTGNSEFQDINGLEGPKFDKGKPSQVHADPNQKTPTELVADYTSTVNPNANYGNSQWPVVPAVNQDLNGVDGPAFNGSVPVGNTQTLHTDLLANMYQSSVNPLSSYGAGQPGGTYPSISPGTHDLDGNLPSNGEYINNLPQ